MPSPWKLGYPIKERLFSINKRGFYIYKIFILIILVQIVIYLFLVIEPRYIYRTLRFHKAGITSLATDNNYLYSGSLDGYLAIWDKSNLTVSRVLNLTESISSIFVYNGFLAAASSNRLYIWNNTDFHLIRLILHPEAIKTVYIDDNYIYSGSYDNYIRIYNTDFKLIKKIRLEDSIWAIATDNKYIYAASRNNHIYVLNKTDFSVIKQLVAHHSIVMSICTTERYLVSGSFDNNIIVWDKKDFQKIKILSGHKQGVWAIFCDNKYIYTGSDDTTIIVWDIERLVPVKTLGIPYQTQYIFKELLQWSEYPHQYGIKAISADKNYIYSGSYDTTIKLWEKPPYTGKPEKQRHTAAGILITLILLFFVFLYVEISQKNGEACLDYQDNYDDKNI